LQGGSILDNLPSLKRLEFWSPPPDNDLFILPVRAESVVLKDLPNLKKIPRTRGYKYGIWPNAELVIRNVGLDRIDPFFVAQETNWSFTAEVSGIPNVHHLNYSLQSQGSVSIAGNGNLSFQIATYRHDQRRVDTGNLTLSGLSSFSVLRPVNESEPENRMAGYGVYIDTLRVQDSENLVTLPLSIDGMQNLTVVDNPRLTTMLSVWSSYSFGWDELVISGNPLLRFNSSVVVTDEFASAKWQNSSWPLAPDFYWPKYNVNTIVLEGHFDNAFL
jgi:hypothetical protein